MITGAHINIITLNSQAVYNSESDTEYIFSSVDEYSQEDKFPLFQFYHRRPRLDPCVFPFLYFLSEVNLSCSRGP